MKRKENLSEDERIKLILQIMQIDISAKSLAEAGKRYAAARDSGQEFMQQFEGLESKSAA
jgi:hypothetical protein